MKILSRIIISGLLLLVLVVATFFIMKYVSSRDSFKIYSNLTYGFTFSYPSSLFLSTLASTTISSGLNDVTFLSYRKNSTYKDTNFFVVSYAPTLADAFVYFPVSTSTPYHLKDYILHYKDHMKDYSNFPLGTAWSEETINGIMYYKLTAPGLQSYLYEDKGIYVLTFSTLDPENNLLSKYIQKILESVRFD